MTTPDRNNQVIPELRGCRELLRLAERSLESGREDQLVDFVTQAEDRLQRILSRFA